MSKNPPRGRPVERPLPSRIDASPEEIARAFFRLPADHEWQYDKTPKNRRGKRIDKVQGYE